MMWMPWLLAGVLMGNAAPVIPDPLSLPAAMALFEAHGFDLAIAQAQVAASAGDAKAAAAFVNPEVAGTVSHAGRPYRVSVCPPGQCSATGYTATLSDQAGLFDVATGKRGLRRDVGAQILAAAQHGRDDAQRILAAALKGQFFQLALDAALLQFVTQSEESFAQSKTLFADRYAAGDISEADYLRVAVAASLALQQVDAAKAALADDRLALAMLMGVSGPVPEFSVTAPWPGDAAVRAVIDRPIEALFAQAQDHRPDLKAYVARAHSAERAATLAVRARIPDTALSFNYQQFGTGQNAIQPRTYTGGLSLALPLWYQNQGEIDRARADARRADIEVAKLFAQVQSDVRRSHTALGYAYAQFVRSRDLMLTDADRALGLVRLQYTKGAASLLDLLDAQRTHIAVNEGYIENANLFWAAVISLEQAVAGEVLP